MTSVEANHPLANHQCFIMNKFEHVWAGSLYGRKRGHWTPKSEPCVDQEKPPLDVNTKGVGPQVNKFEQVSSDDHQMPGAQV